MPRRSRSKSMKGGLFGFGESSGSGWSSWNPFKKSNPVQEPMQSPAPPMQSPPMQSQPMQSAPMQSAPMQSAAAQPVTGGKYKSKRRYMKGGFTSNAPTMSVAGYAAPISGVPNAQPQVWVGKGGRRTRRRHNRKHRHTKSCKHYRKH